MQTSTSSLTLNFGGSFNPIHNGHLIVARAIAEQAGYAHVRLIPANESPLKRQERHMASAADRLAMCREAVDGDPFFEVSACDIERPPPSFTIDTVRHLRRQGEREVHWLIGADSVLSLPKWHEWAALMTEVQWVVAARPGYEPDWDRLPAELAALKDRRVVAPLVQISATDIRLRQQAGLSIRYLVPPAVERYIIANGLYR